MKRFLFIFALFIQLSALAQQPQEIELPESIVPNLHEIDKGKYFRSAQLTATELEDLIKTKNIKTVINLRGENPQDKWFQEESDVVKKHDLLFINIGMSAARLPHRDDLLKLLDAFRTAPRPMLVHCKAGADRTGEASAIYQMLYQGKSRKEALKMLSIWYLHLKATKPAKDYFIEKVWQGEQWAYDSYKPCEADYEYYDKNSGICKAP